MLHMPFLKLKHTGLSYPKGSMVTRTVQPGSICRQ